MKNKEVDNFMSIVPKTIESLDISTEELILLVTKSSHLLELILDVKQDESDKVFVNDHNYLKFKGDFLDEYNKLQESLEKINTIMDTYNETVYLLVNKMQRKTRQVKK